MPRYTFRLIERDLQRPWIVVGQDEPTVRVEPDVDPLAWARQQWPPPRWSVELGPGELQRWLESKRR
jgi:hypothetical protein